MTLHVCFSGRSSPLTAVFLLMRIYPAAFSYCMHHPILWIACHAWLPSSRLLMPPVSRRGVCRLSHVSPPPPRPYPVSLPSVLFPAPLALRDSRPSSLSPNRSHALRYAISVEVRVRVGALALCWSRSRRLPVPVDPVSPVPVNIRAQLLLLLLLCQTSTNHRTVGITVA